MSTPIAKASRSRLIREEHLLHIVERDGERIAVLVFYLPQGWHWKTITAAGVSLRYRRALVDALRAAPTPEQQREARERAALHIVTGPYSEPHGRPFTGPDCASGITPGKVSENV